MAPSGLTDNMNLIARHQAKSSLFALLFPGDNMGGFHNCLLFQCSHVGFNLGHNKHLSVKKNK